MPEAMTMAKSLILWRNSSAQIAIEMPMPAGNEELYAAAMAMLSGNAVKTSFLLRFNLLTRAQRFRWSHRE